MVFSLALSEEHRTKCGAGVSLLKNGQARYTNPDPSPRDFNLIKEQNPENAILQYLSVQQRLDYLIPLLSKPFAVKILGDSETICRFCAFLHKFLGRDNLMMRPYQQNTSFLNLCLQARLQPLQFKLPKNLVETPNTAALRTVTPQSTLNLKSSNVALDTSASGGPSGQQKAATPPPSNKDTRKAGATPGQPASRASSNTYRGSTRGGAARGGDPSPKGKGKPGQPCAIL